MQLSSSLIVLLVLCYCVVIYAQTQCPAAPSSPQDRRTDKTKLRVATFNGEWLFLSRSNCPGSGCPWGDREEAERHLAVIAQEITIINADILNLVEVQDCNVLHALIKLLGPSMGYVPYLLTGTDTATGQNVGLLTRVDPSIDLQRTANRVTYPLPASKCGSSSSGTSAVSKHYFTTFEVEGLPKPLALFGMHFLAFPDDPARCVQREAQAQVIANLLETVAFAKDYSVVVLGDLNDFDPTVHDAAGSVPISAVLDILRDPVKSLAGDELVNSATFIKNSENVYSCWYDRTADCTQQPGELTLIDHLLLSNDLVSLVDQSWIDHSYGPLCNSLESDHWPVIVQFDLNAKF